MKKLTIAFFALLAMLASVGIHATGKGYEKPSLFTKGKLVGGMWWEFNGRVECQPENIYSSAFSYGSYLNCGEEKYGSVRMVLQVETPAGDSALFYTWVNLREANTSFERSKYKVVFAQISSEPRYPNRPTLKLIDFYISEYVDSVSNRTIGIEYGSKWGICGECGLDKIFCTSHLMNESRIEYSEPEYEGKTTETKMFEATNGAYLYELRNSSGKAVGIRYYCKNNNKEYKMYFK